MNVEIVTEAAQFPEKEYINGIFLVVYAGNRDGVGNRWWESGKVEMKRG